MAPAGSGGTWRLLPSPVGLARVPLCPRREKLDSFLPAHLCRRSHGLFAALRGRGAKAVPGEQGLLAAYRQVKDVADGGPEAPLSTHHRAYLLKCHELPFYG